jgi:hypothetical protein
MRFPQRCHYSFFEAAITGALADTIYRTFDLARSCVDCSQTIRHCHAKIVVTVHAQRDVIDFRHVIFQVPKQTVEFGGNRVADRVGNIDCCRTGLNRRRNNLGQIRKLGTRRVLGRKLNVIDQFPRHLYGADGTLDDFFLGHLELVLAMYGAGCDKDVDTMFLSSFNRCIDFLDIGRIAASKTADYRTKIAVRYRLDRIEVSRGRRFSLSVMLQPGACSPSRKVVSKIRILLSDIGLSPVSGGCIYSGVYSDSQSIRLRRPLPIFSIG